MSVSAFSNNILDRLLHFVSRITAKTKVKGSSLSKNEYC
jgi:hypothetical protein